MGDVTIVSVVDVGGDVLHVTATDSDGNELTATGWVSATTNHYDDDAYYPAGSTVAQDGVDESGVALPPRDVSGQLKPEAVPRAMTPAEVGEYAKRLVLEQNQDPDATPAPAPTPIAFEES